MSGRLAKLFPYGIAVVLPPAGLIIGLFALQEDRVLGIRVIATALLAAVVWTLLFVG